MLLSKINQPSDLKKLPISKLPALAEEIREAILNRSSIKGGHVGGNLGFVECSIALHYVFDSPTDKIVFDVSHQCYAHKILTGRKNGFLNEEEFSTVSGYTNPDESEHDVFVVGHTSTSVSLATGLCFARDLKGEKYNVIAVIGDGSLSGGEALEGLDFAGEYDSNLIIVVNDNQMSIAQNHGGIYKNLKLLRNTKGKSENNIFKDMGLDYLFVEDGNDVNQVITALKKVKDINRPIVVHVCTQKGKGFLPAEKDKERWHWRVPFDAQTANDAVVAPYSFVDFTRDLLIKELKQDSKKVIVCAATPSAIGFTSDQRDKIKGRFIDVGIAEEHAVSLISGMAKGGAKPVFCVQSSFLQRCYDQLSQDLALNKSPAVILVYSSGIHLMRDATHLGIFDISYISNIPNITYLSPVCGAELENAITYAFTQNEGPVVIRVPTIPYFYGESCVDFNRKRYEVVKKGNKVAILALGNHFSIGSELVSELEKNKINPTLINPVFTDCVDEQTLNQLVKDHELFVVLEDGVLEGGFGHKVSAYLSKIGVKTLCYGYKKQFIDRFDLNEELVKNRLTAALISADVLKSL